MTDPTLEAEVVALREALRELVEVAEPALDAWEGEFSIGAPGERERWGVRRAAIDRARALLDPEGTGTRSDTTEEAR